MQIVLTKPVLKAITDKNRSRPCDEFRRTHPTPGSAVVVLPYNANTPVFQPIDTLVFYKSPATAMPTAPRAAPAYIGFAVGAAASELADEAEDDRDALAEEAADAAELVAELSIELKDPAAPVAEVKSAMRELWTSPVAVAITLLMEAMPAEASD